MLLQRSSRGESFCDISNPSSKLNISFGDIVKDPVPDNLIELEIVDLQNSRLGNMTDDDFIKMGDEVPLELDTGKSKVTVFHSIFRYLSIFSK